MRLLKIYKSSECYVIEALKPFRICKIKFGRRKVKYRNKKDIETWVYLKSDKEVTSKENSTLCRWIREHQKYCESNHIRTFVKAEKKIREVTATIA